MYRQSQPKCVSQLVADGRSITETSLKTGNCGNGYLVIAAVRNISSRGALASAAITTDATEWSGLTHQRGC